MIATQSHRLQQDYQTKITEDAKIVQATETSEYYNKPLDLYWLEATSLTATQVLTVTSKTLDSSGSQINVQRVLCTHNSKRTYKEYVEFTDNFVNVYERFFSNQTFDSIDKLSEYIKASSGYLSLMLKSFGLPGRVSSANSLEESRSMFIL